MRVMIEELKQDLNVVEEQQSFNVHQNQKLSRKSKSVRNNMRKNQTGKLILYTGFSSLPMF